MSQGWKTIADVVDIGAPEPYDRYFGCHHREFNMGSAKSCSLTCKTQSLHLSDSWASAFLAQPRLA